nr:dolichol-phosphate mannosyltransferase subunit 3 [Ipomoea batatas]
MDSPDANLSSSRKLHLAGLLVLLCVSWVLLRYCLLLIGLDLMKFLACPLDDFLLQQDNFEAKDFLMKKGVDVGYN